MNELTRIVNELNAAKKKTAITEAEERAAAALIRESQQRIRDFAEAAKRIFAEDQLFAEVEQTHGIGVSESMKFRLGSKPERATALYPKTNRKRTADDYNEQVGGWVASQKAAGHQLLQREGDDPLVVDAMDDEGLFATMVVHGLHDSKNSNFRVDFYNQRHGGENEFSGDHPHAGPFKFAPIELEDTASSDQRNVPTKAGDTRKQAGRRKDGDSLRGLTKSNKPPRKT